jgi:hypothetical protein
VVAGLDVEDHPDSELGRQGGAMPLLATPGSSPKGSASSAVNGGAYARVRVNASNLDNNSYT